MTSLDLSEFEPDIPHTAVDRALGQLSKQDRAKFEAALAHPNVKHTKIAERFNARGIEISDSAVRRYRIKMRVADG